MKYLTLLSLLLFSTISYALVGIAGKVTDIEGTYLPGIVIFQMDNGNATCPKGTYMKWQKDTENNKAVYSMMMTALTSGKQILFYINDGDTTCAGQYVHFIGT